MAVTRLENGFRGRQWESDLTGQQYPTKKEGIIAENRFIEEQTRITDFTTALKVLESVRNDAYPPTNLSLLMNSAITIYRAVGIEPETRQGIGDILRWALVVFEKNG